MRLAAITTLAFLLVLGGCATTSVDSDATPQDPNVDSPPMGRLGHPIGTYLKIEGIRAAGFKTGANTLSVDTVNDQTLPNPTGIWIDNINQLPLGERCVLRGFESARWIGIPPEVEQATGLVYQAKWQLQRFFVATSVDSPRSIVIE